MPIPDALDVANALENLAAGLVLDPDACAPAQAWVCLVIDVISGERLSAGIGLTKNEAVASAWVACLPVEQLLNSILGRIPPPLPDGRVRFELGPPGSWERVVSAAATPSGLTVHGPSYQAGKGKSSISE
jgi:hypothetical protein